MKRGDQGDLCKEEVEMKSLMSETVTVVTRGKPSPSNLSYYEDVVLQR